MARTLFASTLSLPSARGWYLHASPWVIHDLTRNIFKFILDFRKQQDSLDDIHNIIECLLEINQEVLSECKEEISHAQLFPLVFDYYRLSHGTSKLYIDFVRLLKDVTESWLSVKLALEQIVARSKVDDYTYEEMLQQVNDLEAPKTVRFTDNFVISFAYISKQTASFLRHLNEEIRCNQNFKSLKVLAKVSSVTIAGIFSMVATYVGDHVLLEGMKDITSYSMLMHLIQSFLKESGSDTEWFRDTRGREVTGYERELGIRDFNENAILLQELKKKMAWFGSLTKENEEEMMIVIDKLEKKINNLSMTIEDMSSHAGKYSTDIREVGIKLNQFIAGCNILVNKFGFYLIHDENILQLQQSDDAMTFLFQATLSFPIDMQWYMNALEADYSRLSCHCNIHDHTCKIYSSIFDVKKIHFFNIQKIIKCVLKINQEAFMVLTECKAEWRHTQLLPMVYEYYEISCATSQLYDDFIKLLKDTCDRWLRVKAEVEGRPVDTFKETLQRLSDLEEAPSVCLSGEFLKSLAYICKQTVVFLGHFNEEIQELKSVKVLAKGSSGLISGVFCVLATCMLDSSPFDEMNEVTLNSVWLHLIRNFSWKSPSRKSDRKLLWIGDCDDKLFFLHQLKEKSNIQENEQQMMTAIHNLEKKINLLSMTIEDMTSLAHKFSHDTREAGITLEISRNQIIRPAVKRKR